MDISYCSLGLLGTAVFASYLDPEVWNMNLVKKKKVWRLGRRTNPKTYLVLIIHWSCINWCIGNLGEELSCKLANYLLFTHWTDMEQHLELWLIWSPPDDYIISLLAQVWSPTPDGSIELDVPLSSLASSWLYLLFAARQVAYTGFTTIFIVYTIFFFLVYWFVESIVMSCFITQCFALTVVNKNKIHFLDV